MDFLAHINAERILVAESNPDDMSYTTRVLEEAGYNVQKAYYAGDALYAVEQGQFALMLVDVRMRDRDQKLLIDKIGTLPGYIAVPWIALVDAQSDKPETFLQQGAAAYLRRPLQMQHVLKRVHDVLQGQEVKPSEPKKPAVHEPRDATKQLLERRLVEQQTLSALARSLSAVLDLDTLLTQVVDAAVRLSNAEEGLLLLPDEEGKALYIRAVKGIDSETARNFRIKTQDTLAGQVFRSGQPVLVGDQGWQKVKTEYLVKSLLYVPLSSKGQIIGVLGVNNKSTERTFDQHDSELLQDLAAHAAIAIENARLYEESILRTHELSTLVQASQAANSTLAIDRVLSIISAQLIGALGLNQCIISEWSPQSQRLDTLSISYRALWRTSAGPALTGKTDPAIEQAFSQQRVVTFSPEPAEHPLSAWLPHRYQARKVIYIPLLVQHQPLGVVKLCYVAEDETADPYTTNVQKLALESVFRLTDAHIEQHQSHLFRTAQQIIDISKADLCEIALWNPDKRQFNVALSYGEAIWLGSSKPGLELVRSPQLTQTLTDQLPFTGAATDELRYLVERKYGQSFLGVPLVIKGETAGLVILIDTLHDRYFARREVELAQALVLQAANALGNARLYRDLETSLAELHHTQSKLVQTARLSAMGELAAAVAHQINNPLTTILVDTEMMLQDVKPDDPNTEALEAISRAGKRAHEVVRRLLGMARQYSPEDTVESVNVNESIRNTLMLVKGHVQQGNVALIVQLEGDIPPVLGIRGQLEDVWLNLLLNARDAVANRSNSRIGISSSYYTEDEFVEVSVWDNGTGINPEQVAQIFEPFFTTKPPGEGTGLGLHICRQIVEKCKGSINVESAYNEGTRFIIRLPIYHR